MKTIKPICYRESQCGYRVGCMHTPIIPSEKICKRCTCSKCDWCECVYKQNHKEMPFGK